MSSQKKGDINENEKSTVEIEQDFSSNEKGYVEQDNVEAEYVESAIENSKEQKYSAAPKTKFNKPSNQKNSKNILPLPERFVKKANELGSTLNLFNQAPLPKDTVETGLTGYKLLFSGISRDHLHHFLTNLKISGYAVQVLMSRLQTKPVEISLYTNTPDNDTFSSEFTDWSEHEKMLSMRIFKDQMAELTYEIGGLGVKAVHFGGDFEKHLSEVLLNNFLSIVFNKEQYNLIKKVTDDPEGFKPEKYINNHALDSTIIDAKISGYVSDDIEARNDQLDIKSEVKALCGIVASRDVTPPLSIGLFGDWGTGKSFFIKEMRSCIGIMAKEANKLEEAKKIKIKQRETAKKSKQKDDTATVNKAEADIIEPVYWSNIAQITFNAWHYEDADLWASMVVHIFDELADHVAKSDEKHLTIDEKRKRLFEKIQLVQNEVKECNVKIKNTEKELKIANSDFIESEKIFQEAESEFSYLKSSLFAKNLFSNFLNKNEKLKTMLDESDFNKTLETAENLKYQAEELATDAGKLKARLISLSKTVTLYSGVFWLCLVLLFGFLISDVMASLLDKFEFGNSIESLISKSTAILSSATFFVLLIKKWIRPVNKIIESIEGAYTDFKNESDKELKQQLNDAEKNMESLSNDFEEHKKYKDKLLKELSDLQHDLESIKAGRRLYQFIEEQATSDKYRGKLGIIASIREDFKQLSDLLDTQSTEKRNSWKLGHESVNDGGAPVADIDRIVLYIDDLDRCTPERVVEVLHAVHLLLAFKLFVVVVAVDSRWLINSLKASVTNLTSEKLIENINDDAMDTYDNLVSTPQNYLEKIFQIPYTLPQMTEKGFENILASLCAPVDEAPLLDNKTEFANSDYALNAMNQSASSKEMPEFENQGGYPESVDSENSETDAYLENENNIRMVLPSDSKGKNFDKQKNIKAAKSEPAGDKLTKYEINLNPEKSNISRYELQFMIYAYHGLRTPRSINRFVNTYRLIRSLVTRKESVKFFDELNGEYREVIILLIILIGFPHEAEAIFLKLINENDEVKFSGFINGLIALASKSYKQRLKSLKEEFELMPDYSDFDVSKFKYWVYRVSRFSFRPIHLPKRK